MDDILEKLFTSRIRGSIQLFYRDSAEKVAGRMPNVEIIPKAGAGRLLFGRSIEVLLMLQQYNFIFHG